MEGDGSRAGADLNKVGWGLLRCAGRLIPLGLAVPLALSAQTTLTGIVRNDSTRQ